MIDLEPKLIWTPRTSNRIVRPSKSSSSYPTAYLSIQRLKEALRLNCGLCYVVILCHIDTIPNPHVQAESVTATWKSYGHGGFEGRSSGARTEATARLNIRQMPSRRSRCIPHLAKELSRSAQWWGAASKIRERNRTRAKVVLGFVCEKYSWIESQWMDTVLVTSLDFLPKHRYTVVVAQENCSSFFLVKRVEARNSGNWWI